MTTVKPFIVQTTEGVYCAEFESMEQAEASASQRNKEATAMGVEARYEAKAR